eukprot:CAMPEP_0114274834 /NCGR_PEP_ID=MMETSP0058-20121206/29997_1 /TAXON_ID=36894 /ORGANISM="Pyramimonas parkeae, CCMP726" /LENGTH=124 /DNA_ID=CAMNT_0001394693 /DNA_START=264 /DNA_END=638 /DNA_ORIENTATION=-
MSAKRTYRGAPNGAVQRAAPSPPTQRTSARRQPRVDLSRLETSSLRKYRRFFKLGDLAAGVSKEDLVPAVMRHWQNQVLEDEYETLLSFAVTLRKQSVAASGGTGVSGTNLHKVKQKPGPKPRK